MNGKKNALIVSFQVLVFFILSSSVVHAEQVPKTGKAIPVFTGAVRDSIAESEMNGQEDEEISSKLGSSERNVYKTGASPEEVFGYYLKMIGGKEGEYTEDPRGIQPGAVTQVWYNTEFWEDQDFKDIVYETSKSDEWMKMKQTLEKSRKPYKPGKWIKNARFEWMMKKSNNDLVEFYINIEDITFNWGTESAPTDNRRTISRIDVTVITHISEEAVREEAEKELDKDTEALSISLKRHPPSEKDLGAPIYPGSRLDAENTAGMSAGNDYMMYLYLTEDPPSKVAAFYEQKLKTKSFSSKKDCYMFALKGELPIPDEGISVEPNIMFGGSAKTVITIQKRVKGQE